MCIALPAGAGPTTLAEAKEQLLQQLQADGSLTPAAAEQARAAYIQAADQHRRVVEATAGAASGVEPASAGAWGLPAWSLASALKVVAVALLLFAFGGLIQRVARQVRGALARVPVGFYQAGLLAVTVGASAFPSAVWAAQRFYIALFGSLANLLVLWWVLASHPAWRARLLRCLDWGVPIASVVSAALTLYFGAWALVYASPLWGFLAVVALSGVFTFSLYYRPGVLSLQFDERALSAVVFGHLAVGVLYAGLWLSGALHGPWLVFRVGLETYGALALGVGLLVGASPFYKAASWFYAGLFAAVALAALGLHFFAQLTGPAVILCTLFVLVGLEWLLYWGFKASTIAGLVVAGGLLFGSALLLERYAAVALAHVQR